VAEVKEYKLDAGFDSKSEPKKEIYIIDAEPSATIATTNIQPGEIDDPEEGEHLFHSQMWVKGTSMHFIIDSGRHKTLISIEFFKCLALPKMLH
jgi:hypothetical protein